MHAFSSTQASKQRKIEWTPRVFLAGPMSNRPNFGHDEFDQHDLALGQWFHVANPARHDLAMYPDMSTWSCYEAGDVAAAIEKGFDLAEAKRWCLTKVLSADIVALLPGWRDSRGVRTEMEVAEALGIPCVEIHILYICHGMWNEAAAAQS